MKRKSIRKIKLQRNSKKKRGGGKSKKRSMRSTANSFSQFVEPYSQSYDYSMLDPSRIKQMDSTNIWEKNVRKNPGNYVFGEDSIWTKLNTYLPPDFSGTDEQINAKKKEELKLLKYLCISDDYDKCEIIKQMIPRYKTGHMDEKKHKTICVLLFIISFFTVILKDNCKIIIKGGFAVEAAISKIPETNDDPSLEEYFKIINDYSTNDIDLLIVPIDGQTPLYYAQQITNLIMWLISGNNQSIYRLSVLDKSMEENPLQQIIKLAIDETYNDQHKYTAVMDINFNVNNEIFYIPNPIPLFYIQNIFITPFGSQRTNETRVIHLALEVVSSYSLALDRMYHLILYKFPTIVNKEKIDALRYSTLDPEYAREEIARLSMIDYSNSKYIASIEKSLRVLFAASCILRKGENKSKSEIFDSYLYLIRTNYPNIVIDERILQNIEKTIGVTQI